MKVCSVCWIAVAILAACSGSSATPRDAGPPICGDGVASATEDCDGLDLRGRTCAALGLGSGQLACLATCAYDLRACGSCGDGVVSGGEQCDDGNQAAGDCCDACVAEPGCEIEPGPTQLTLDASGKGELRGNLPAEDVDLVAVAIPAGSTGTLVAAVQAEGDRCPDLRLEILDADGVVVARGEGACAQARAAGLGGPSARVRLMARAGAAQPVGRYQLAVTLALAPCGDGVAQAGQDCDDGNSRDGDGCSSRCGLEAAAEREPDDQLVAANGPFTPPFAVAATIDRPVEGGHDDDWYELSLDRPATLVVEIDNPDGPGCGGISAEPILYRFDGAMLAVQATAWELPDEGACLRVQIGGAMAGGPMPQAGQLAPGGYYLDVLGAPSPGRYRLKVLYRSLCGNGVVEPDEACDGGAGCTTDCLPPPVCGNGRLEKGEECDDGNDRVGDGCAACRREAAACGNGFVEPPEECDDGNHFGGDCCDPTCHAERGCETEPNGLPMIADGPFPAPIVLRGRLGVAGPPVPGGPSPQADVDIFVIEVPVAADLRLSNVPGPAGPPPPAKLPLPPPPPLPLSPASPCAGSAGMRLTLTGPSGDAQTVVADDSGCLTLRRTVPAGPHFVTITGAPGADPTYAVSATLDSACGDGVVAGTETCDDGSEGCLGAGCGHEPSCGDGIVTPPESCDDGNRDDGDACSPGCVGGGAAGVCGDGHPDPGEACDDGNRTPGDGCSAECTVEVVNPPACGDGVLDPGESCDDGNHDAGDGCGPTCAAEPGHFFETEPNDDGLPSIANSDFRAVAADGPFVSDVLVHARIWPFGDDDVFAVQNPGSAAVRVRAETFGAVAGSCFGVDTELRARNAAGQLLAFDAGSGIDACSLLELTLEPGATVYLQVTDAGDNSLIPSYLLEIGFH